MTTTGSKPRLSAQVKIGLLLALVVLGTLANGYIGLKNLPQADYNSQFGNAVVGFLLSTAFGWVGVLILAKQPHNHMGWLVIAPFVSVTLSTQIPWWLSGITAPPKEPSIALAALLWLNGASWTLLIFPLMLLALLFPTGQLLGPRWRWAYRLVLLVLGTFLFITLFNQKISSSNDETAPSWLMDNPIGFIPMSFSDTFFNSIVWNIALMLCAVLSFAALVLRFRSASLQERQQIKWLAYFGVIFTLIYLVSVAISSLNLGIISTVSDVLLGVSLLGFPAAIAISILRYRLWNIDVIIRRTLIYAVLTALVAGIYFVLVTVLQQALALLAPQGNSDLVTVASTLVVAGLFLPLRNRIQAFIDRRFFRRKYNAEQTVARFAAEMRDAVEMDEIAAKLMDAVDDNLQPGKIVLWLPASSAEKQLGES